jgi:hypothetical protein
MISEIVHSHRLTQLLLAYVDPGTGSYLLQLLIATVLGGLFVIKTYWRRIMGFLSDKFSKSKES